VVLVIPGRNPGFPLRQNPYSEQGLGVGVLRVYGWAEGEPEERQIME